MVSTAAALHNSQLVFKKTEYVLMANCFMVKFMVVHLFGDSRQRWKHAKQPSIESRVKAGSFRSKCPVGLRKSRRAVFPLPWLPEWLEGSPRNTRAATLRKQSC